MTAPDIQRRLDFALQASAEAAIFVMQHFQDAGLRVDSKADLSPVTIADRGAEELLRRELLREFPHDAVMGEEFGETPGSSGYRWILDPVDGTKSFIHGVPLFGMLIGLQFQGDNVAGICRMPALQEAVWAARGGGAWWQQGDQPVRPARVRSCATLKQSLCCFTAVDGFDLIHRPEVLQRLSASCWLTRGWGDCYGHALVATGRADVMVDPLLEEWDAAALIPIVQEAGGVFMNWDGQSSARGGNGISLTPQLKAEMLELLG